MARFYRLDVQPDLFGQWSLVREWGRIGSGGQVRVTPYPSESRALAAQEALAIQKERRGYHCTTTVVC
ncbi:WGR domain-containing protein [Pannonibacter carbonis]|uniref:WGR domain-containing protein n=1 Tax=Pannonibacter carbonis TaxID=2067569 RepID=UPI0018E554E7